MLKDWEGQMHTTVWSLISNGCFCHLRWLLGLSQSPSYFSFFYFFFCNFWNYFFTDNQAKAFTLVNYFMFRTTDFYFAWKCFLLFVMSFLTFNLHAKSEGSFIHVIHKTDKQPYKVFIILSGTTLFSFNNYIENINVLEIENVVVALRICKKLLSLSPTLSM